MAVAEAWAKLCERIELAKQQQLELFINNDDDTYITVTEFEEEQPQVCHKCSATKNVLVLRGFMRVQRPKVYDRLRKSISWIDAYSGAYEARISNHAWDCSNDLLLKAHVEHPQHYLYDCYLSVAHVTLEWLWWIQMDYDSDQIDTSDWTVEKDAT